MVRGLAQGATEMSFPVEAVSSWCPRWRPAEQEGLPLCHRGERQFSGGSRDQGKVGLRLQPTSRVPSAELGTFKSRRGGARLGLGLINLSPPRLGKSCQMQFRKTSLMNMQYKMGRFHT